jgi:hypothetical protein
MRIKNSMLLLFALGTFASCTKVVTKEKPVASNDHYMTNAATPTSSAVAEAVHEVKDGNVKLRYMKRSAFDQLVSSGAIKVRNNVEALVAMGVEVGSLDEKALGTPDIKSDSSEESLVLGFSYDLLGEQNIFGGVITKVSDHKNANVGDMKLSQLEPIHVTTSVQSDDSGAYLVLTGCVDDCSEQSIQQTLITIPIVGIDNDKKQILVDLSAIGNSLNLMKMHDPSGKRTKLQPKSSETITFDYDVKTLVFDIKSTFVPAKPEKKNPTDTDPADPINDPNAPVTEVTARWYLKLGSVFNPAFEARSPVKEVGFFETTRAHDVKIERHSLTDVNKSVHYFVKNVPEEYKKHVSISIANWNKEFKAITGRTKDFISHEFIPAGDVRNERIVAGDIRYNVIEWDLENQASYGGLGPSVANQFTGEIISTNILLQGPKIVEMYGAWFKASETARSLIAQGRNAEADVVFKKYVAETTAEVKLSKQAKYSMSLGSLRMKVPANEAQFEDPAVKDIFEIVPKGMTYENYMPGYFQDMIQHEMGHNMGLRHNFYGNLGAAETTGHGLTMITKGTVSRSVMEYLGRAYRYMDGIGPYDRMAIAYGYMNKAPSHSNWFCTDENESTDSKDILTQSPECSKADATSDPFSYWQVRLDRAIELTVSPGNTRAPVAGIADITSQVSDLTKAFAGYVLAAEKTSESWMNFFGKSDRPEKGDISGIKAYVIKTYTDQLCNQAILDVIQSKESAEVQEMTKKNYESLILAIEKNFKDYGLLKADDKICR